jgi:hypothetical protein
MDVARQNASLIAALGAAPWAARADAVARRLRADVIAEGGHLLELLPRPIFCGPDEVRLMGERARALVAFQTRLARRLIAEEGRAAFLTRFGVLATMGDLVRWDELAAPTYLIARLDLLRLDSGYWCCEINVDSCVAGAEIFDTARDTVLALGFQAEGLPVRPLDALAGLIAARARAYGAARIVILDWSVGGGSAGKGYMSYDRMRAAIARASDLPTHIADEVTFDPAWLAPDEASRTFVHRGFMMEEITDGGAFLRRLLAAGAPVYSLLEADIRMDKGWFALMWDAVREGVCTPAERALMEGFVPETWQVTAGAIDGLVARRDGLIFKTRRAFGGAGILVGAQTDEAALRQALVAAPEHWIAQVMLQPQVLAMPHEPGREAEPHELVYGLYLYGDQENGLLLRGSTTSRVVNVSSGRARIAWALAVEPEARTAFIHHLEGAAP